ncbi:MAG: ParA family protein, partial [Ktedonobacteraceae bacterium]
MNEVRSSVRISISLRNQLKVLAKELSTQQFNRVTIVGLLEEGIDSLLRLPLEEWVRWAKEERKPISVGEESIPIRIDAERANKIGLLAATIQQQSHVPMMIVDLTEEAGRRVISQIKKAELNVLIAHDPVSKQFLYEKQEKYSTGSIPATQMKGSAMSEEEKTQATYLATFVVIMVYNRKGGVGKTSVAGNLAAILAALGFHVAIIDGDDQTNVSRLDDKKRAPASLTNVIMETRLGSQTSPAVSMRDAMVQV